MAVDHPTRLMGRSLPGEQETRTQTRDEWADTSQTSQTSEAGFGRKRLEGSWQTDGVSHPPSLAVRRASAVSWSPARPTLSKHSGGLELCLCPGGILTICLSLLFCFVSFQKKQPGTNFSFRLKGFSLYVTTAVASEESATGGCGAQLQKQEVSVKPRLYHKGL